MSDKTIITFDRPDERVLELDRLLPLLRRDDELGVGPDQSHVVRSAVLALDPDTGDLTFYIRLRL